MSNRIAYNSGTAAGKQVAEYVDAVMVALEKGRRLKAQLDAMNHGNPPDTAGVEAEIGGMVAGNGVNLVYIIDVSVQAIDCAQIASLAQLDMGG
jgi:hypothetical protein